MINVTKQITEIKNRLIAAIINTPEIIEAMDVDPAEDVMYNHIFPTMRIPDTETEKKTYICMKVDINVNTGKNTAVKSVSIMFMVLTHQDLQRVSKGIAKGNVRTDYISEQLETLFNDAGIGIGQTKLVSNVEDNIDARHPCRFLRFDTHISNQAYC